MRSLLASAFITLLLAPSVVSAANVFGGQATVTPCFNSAVWASVGPPRSGLYIWTPATGVYPFGVPHSGAWTLGLYGIPYFCIVSIAPLIVFPGISVIMSGSSQ